MKFLSVYIDSKAKDWKDRIICHDPLFETEVVGIMALKSLELKDFLGFVVGGPTTDLNVFIENVKQADKNYELGKSSEIEIFEKLVSEAMECRLEVCYLQTKDYLANESLSKEEVNAKVTASVPFINRMLPNRVFVKSVGSSLRVFVGADVYSGEGIGDLTFESSGDGIKVEYSDFITNDKDQVCWLSSYEGPESWANSLFEVFAEFPTTSNVQDGIIDKVSQILQDFSWEAVKKGQAIMVYDDKGELVGDYVPSNKTAHIKTTELIEKADILFKSMGASKSIGDFKTEFSEKFKKAGYRIQKREKEDLGIIVKKVYQ